MVAWPDAYLQPDRHKDCGFYASAYLCRCLGHPDVTAEQIMAWREETKRLEFSYPQTLGHPVTCFWDALKRGDDAEQRRYWLGEGTREWVEDWLARGYLAVVQVHRIPTMAHALVLLESQGDSGVLLMDPIYGHITEPWDWFLSIGPGHHGAHHVEGWYQREGSK